MNVLLDHLTDHVVENSTIFEVSYVYFGVKA